MRFPRMTKILSLLTALALVSALCCAVAGAAETACYRVAWTDGPAYGYGPVDVPVLVITNDPAQGPVTEASALEEIRFWPFDPEAGLYPAGDGEPAGSRAEILDLAADPARYAVRLREPGKYLISGNEYYLLDLQVPALNALRKELEGLAVQYTGETESKTAKGLHDWLCGRVSSVFPKEDEARLAAACGDPVNALLTGYACRDAYARLYRLVLSASGIRSLVVSGTAGGESAAWTLVRTDGNWLFTDTAMDDIRDKKQSKYLALDGAKIGKDHTLCAADEAFVRDMIRSAALDAVLLGAAEPSLAVYTPNANLNLDILLFDGPSYMVGDSATVTFRTVSNVPFADRIYVPTTTEEYLRQNILYAPWMEKEQYYFVDGCTPMESALTPPEIPDSTELFTVDSVADDLSSFTITFHTPGLYQFWRYNTSFYLISPDQAVPAAIAKEMDAVVAKAKAAATEKDAAKQIFQWIRRKVRYNTPAFEWEKHPEVTIRDLKTKGEAIGALAYGKCVCAGYTAIYDLLMRQAGLTVLSLNGLTQPGDVSHAWNVNRLDGEWSFTDVTWNRFAWTREKMNKDHDAHMEQMVDAYCFGNTFDLLADQVSGAYRPLRCLPAALRSLPRTADGYGFDGPPEKMIQITKLDATDSGVSVTLAKPERIRLTLRKNGKLVSKRKDDSKTAVKQFSTAKVTGNTLRVEIGGIGKTDYLKEPMMYQAVDYEEGEPTLAQLIYYEPLKDKRYGNGNYSHRYWRYRKDLRPESAGWYLTGEGSQLKLQVFFDADGNVEHYELSYTSYMDRLNVSWSATADGTVTAYNHKQVTDPDSVSPNLIDPIIFE